MWKPGRGLGDDLAAEIGRFAHGDTADRVAVEAEGGDFRHALLPEPRIVAALDDSEQGLAVSEGRLAAAPRPQ